MTHVVSNCTGLPNEEWSCTTKHFQHKIYIKFHFRLSPTLRHLESILTNVIYNTDVMISPKFYQIGPKREKIWDFKKISFLLILVHGVTNNRKQMLKSPRFDSFGENLGQFDAKCGISDGNLFKV